MTDIFSAVARVDPGGSFGLSTSFVDAIALLQCQWENESPRTLQSSYRTHILSCNDTS